jgi:hypothetical protein
MSAAYGWEQAWEEIDDDDPHFAGMEYYPIEDEYGTIRLFEGDQFWNTDQRYIIEITNVKQKIYRGVVGRHGERGGVYIFYETDYEEPTDPNHPTHYTDDIKYMNVDDFVDMLDAGELVPHKGNGLPRRPPY